MSEIEAPNIGNPRGGRAKFGLQKRRFTDEIVSFYRGLSILVSH